MTAARVNCRRVAVTGASGMLGAEFVEVLRMRGVDVHALSRPAITLDDPSGLGAAVTGLGCDGIIHCAAETDVDACEADAAMAMRRNRDATLALARAARECRARMIFISSSGVFDGTKSGPYLESDPAFPLTAYARSKREAETSLLALDPSALVVRAGWLYGGGPQHRKNFVAARWREALGKTEIVSASDKCGSPTWTRDLAERVWDLVEAGASGLVHAANAGRASRAEYVTEILSLLGSPVGVRPVLSREFPRRAPVPNNEEIASERWPTWNMAPMRPWRDALAAYLKEAGGAIRAESTPA